MGSKVKSVAVVFFLFFSVLFAFVPTVSAAAPVQSNENPASGSTDQELGFNWNVTVKDPDGDLMNVTITCIAAPSGSSFWPDHVNDSFIVPLSGMSYSTKYFVDVNATDGSSWTNATYNFTTKANPWTGWSDGWTISDIHTGSSTGYEQGNWSFSEHVSSGTLDELWIEANYSHWSVEDDSSWWNGNYTYAVNMTDVNNTFALLNDSGMNRSQGFGWVHHNDSDIDFLYPYIIFAYSSVSDYDVIMWSTQDVWALHWNGTNMTDIFTNASVVYPADDATDISDQWIQEGVYLRGEGNYYKYIYNEHNGSIKFKWWGNGVMNEPVGWAVDYIHANLTHTTSVSHGIGAWDPFSRNAVMQWDIMNIWQLNYTTNSSARCNISGYNESRPHMDFPVIDLGTWSEEVMSYFNNTYFGNMSVDAVRSIMKDNLTNHMNMESRMFEIAKPDAYQQNDTVYYYSCIIDNFTAFDPDTAYDEFLHLHVQMCPEYGIDASEYSDIAVAIDVDNNGVWDVNDRIYWAYAGGTYIVTELVYNGNGDVIPSIYDAYIWQTDQDAVGNLHRYDKHLNYVLNIPLADIIKSNSEPINTTDVFGLSIVTTTAALTWATQLPCVWQNWNETNEVPFWDESNCFSSAIEYFHNGSGEEGDVPNATSIGRWGEGVITGTMDASGTVSHNMSIEASFNDTLTTPSEDHALVNVTVYVNNTGAGNLSGIYLNLTWWNCSCSDLNMTFVSSNQHMSNFTWYNDSCYWIIHNTSIEPLTAGSTWHIWFIVNVTSCPGVSTATETLAVTGNASEMAVNATLTSTPTFRWGVSPASIPFASTTNYMTSFVIPVLVAVGVLILVVGMLFTTGVSRETLITSMIIIVLAAVFLKVIMGV